MIIPYAKIHNGAIINTIAIDDKYSLREAQDKFGMGDLLLPLPDDYAIGDFYDAEFQRWTKKPQEETIAAEQSLEQTKAEAIQRTREWLVQKRSEPMAYNGKLYDVSEEAQNLLTAQTDLYKDGKELDVTVPICWNAIGEDCYPWDYPDVFTLKAAMLAWVTPFIQVQKKAEIMISNADTNDKIQTILQDFM